MRRRGFTFIEIMVIVVIVAMIAALATPRLIAIHNSELLRTEMASIDRLVANARTDAMSRSQSVQFVATASDSLELTVTDSQTSEPTVLSTLLLKNGIKVEKFLLNGTELGPDEWTCSFYSDGTADPVQIQFDINGTKYLLKVDGHSARGRLAVGEADTEDTTKWKAGELVQRS